MSYDPYSYSCSTAGWEGLGWGGYGAYSGYSGSYSDSWGSGASINGAMASSPAVYPKAIKRPELASIATVGYADFDLTSTFLLNRRIDEVIAEFGLQVYEDMATDDQIACCLSLYALAVLGGDLEVEPAIVAEPGEDVDQSTDENRKSEIKRAAAWAAEVKRSIANTPEFRTELKAAFLGGVKFGCGLAEPRWVKVDDHASQDVKGNGKNKDKATQKEAKGESEQAITDVGTPLKPADLDQDVDPARAGNQIYILSGFRARPVRAWAWVVDGYGEPVAIAVQTPAGITQYPRSEYFIFTNNPKDGDVRGTSDLRAAYTHYMLKQQSFPQRSKWLDKFAQPTVDIGYDPSKLAYQPTDINGNVDYTQAAQSPYEQARRIGETFNGGSYIAHPKEWTVQLIQSEQDGGAFLNHEEACNKGIARAMLGTSRATNEAEHGSKADSDSSLDVFQMKVDGARSDLDVAVARDIFTWQIVHNHGESERHLVPRLRFKLARHLQGDLWTAFAGLVNAKAIPPSIAAKVYAAIGLPVPNQNDFDGDRWPGWGSATPPEAMHAIAVAGGKSIGDNVAGKDATDKAVDKSVDKAKAGEKPNSDPDKGGKSASFARGSMASAKSSQKAKPGKSGGSSAKKSHGDIDGGRWITIHGHAVYLVDGKITKGGVPGLTHDTDGKPLGKLKANPPKKRTAGSVESPRPARVRHAASEGHIVGKAEHVHADKIEKSVARAVGGKHLDDNEPVDVKVKGMNGLEHGLEVKSMLKGKKSTITMHDDALLRKVEYAVGDKNRVVHTVAVDQRHVYDGGKNAAHYSGHDLYYRRGAGKYALSRMHKVKDHEELKRLVHMKDEELPPAARGVLPTGNEVDKLKERATKAHEARLRKDRALKARKKAEREAEKSGEVRASSRGDGHSPDSLAPVSHAPVGLNHHYRDDPDSVGSHIDLGDSGPHHDHFHEAFSAIHQVHGDGGLPTVRGVHDQKMGKNEIGQYRATKGTSKAEIAIDSRAPQSAFTAVHETGHFLDHHGIGDGFGMASEDQHPALGGVMKAILKSPEGKELTRELGKKKHPDKGYIDYIGKPSERLARAYAQYIAHKSGNPSLASGLRLERAKRYGKMEHWTDENFAPIAAEFDKAFKAKGWLHE